jgi:hypothetical protein
MIKCKLQKVREYSILPKKEKERLKFGRYLTSSYPVEGLGKTTWLVGADIFLDEKQEITCENVEEIALKCIEFLNTPPPSKHKRGRKPSKLRYGKFEPVPFRVNLKETPNGTKYIRTLLLTDKPKSKFFWGDGPKNSFLTKRAKKRAK